jgi:hypothetical protein
MANGRRDNVASRILAQIEYEEYGYRFDEARNNLSQKKLLEEMNQEQWQRFILADNITQLNIRPPSLIPRRLFKHQTIQLEKSDSISVGPADSKHDVRVVKVNGKPSYLIWCTSPECLKRTVDFGELPHLGHEPEPKDLTTEVLAILGGRKGKFWYSYTRGTVYEKHRQVEVLEKITAHRIKLLQPLTRLINSYDASLTPDENCLRVIPVLAKCLDEMTTISSSQENLKLLEEYDADIVKRYAAHIQSDIDTLNKLLTYLESFQDRKSEHKNANRDRRTIQAILDTSGTQSLKYLVNSLMTNSLIQAECTYDAITAFTPEDDFRKRIDAALRRIDEYQYDPSNTATAAHQMDFGSDEKKSSEQLVYHVSSLQSEEECHRLRMVIAQAEGDEAIVYDEAKSQYSLQSRDNKLQPLVKTAWPKHRNFTGNSVNPSYNWLLAIIISWFRFICYYGKCAIASMGNVPDFILGIISGLFNVDMIQRFFSKCGIENETSFVVWTRKKLLGSHQDQEDILCCDQRYQALLEAMQFPAHSPGVTFGLGVGRFIRSCFSEVISGIITLVQSLTIDLFKGIRNDFYYGGWRDLITGREIGKRHFELLVKEIEALGQEEKRIKEDISKRHQEKYGEIYEGKSIGEEKIAGHRLACIPYKLNTGQWSDPLNISILGGKKMLGAFEDSPVFSMVYFTFLAASMRLPVADFLGPSIINACHQFTLQVAHDSIGARMGAATITAQAASTITETIVEGRDSPASHTAKLFFEEPVIYLIALWNIIHTGKTIIYGDIPFVGDIFLNEVGYIKEFAEFSVGVKFWVLAAHLLEVKNKHNAGERQEIKGEMSRVLKETYRDEKGNTWDQLRDSEKANLLATFHHFIHQLEGMAQNFSLPAPGVQEHPDPASIVNEDKISFLFYITKFANKLALLSDAGKLELTEYAEKHFADKPDILEALHHKLYPEKSRTFVGDLVHRIFGYVPLIAKLFFIPFTGNVIRPCKALIRKLEKDLALLGDFVLKIPSLIMSALRIIPIRVMCRFLAVNVIAKIEIIMRKIINKMIEVIVNKIIDKIRPYLALCFGYFIPSYQCTFGRKNTTLVIVNIVTKGFYSSYAWLTEQFTSVQQTSRKVNVAPVPEQVFMRGMSQGARSQLFKPKLPPMVGVAQQPSVGLGSRL